MPTALSPLIKIITYIFTLLVGIFINRLFEDRPRLVAYFGHISSAKAKYHTGK